MPRDDDSCLCDPSTMRSTNAYIITGCTRASEVILMPCMGNTPTVVHLEGFPYNSHRLWDMRTSKVAYTTKLKRNGYMYLAWNPARPDILAAVSQESEIAFMDARSQKVLATLPSVKEVLPNLTSSCHCFRSWTPVQRSLESIPLKPLSRTGMVWTLGPV